MVDGACWFGARVCPGDCIEHHEALNDPSRIGEPAAAWRERGAQPSGDSGTSSPRAAALRWAAGIATADDLRALDGRTGAAIAALAEGEG